MCSVFILSALRIIHSELPQKILQLIKQILTPSQESFFRVINISFYAYWLGTHTHRPTNTHKYRYSFDATFYFRSGAAVCCRGGRDQAVLPQCLGDRGPRRQGPQERDREDRGPNVVQEEGRHPPHPCHP